MLKSLLVMSCVVGATLSVPVESDETIPRPGEFCGYESCPRTEAGVLNVHIVPHTHDDVGWLKTVDQYYYGSRNNIQKAGVQYILDSVIKELWADPKRKFIYVETAFFWKWWVRQTNDVRHKVHALVRQGRLQFVGGAWSMNDEAATHYQSTIDQFTWGLRKLNQTFGHCALPRVGWQIDPFGHAREFASLLSGMGYDGLFLGRIDYQDKRARLQDKHMEMLWRGDDDLGPPSDIFTGVLYNTYSPPPGFCFDVLCSDEPIIDDPDSPMYNVEERISMFLSYVKKQSDNYATNNVMVTMGGDFTYQDALMWYTNLDKLIEYTNVKAAKDHLNVKLFYSTPNCYLKAVKDANPTLPIKQDDFFPYASDPNAYWTGYFTSRPTTKYFEREGNNYLQALKQLQVLAGLEEHNMFVLNELKSAMGVMQHHDAVTGTEKEHVTHDYERLLDLAVEDALLIARQAFNKQAQSDPLKPPILSFDRCHFNESRCHTSENSEQFVVTVYNPLAWSLDAVPVRIPVVDHQYAVVAPNGKEIVSQIIELPEQVTKIPTRDSKATHEVVFLAYNVPAMGYKAFYVKRKSKIAKREAPYSADTATDMFNDKKSIYHMNMNDYWRDVREQPIVEIRNIDENETNKANQPQTNEETTLKEPKLLFTKLKVPAGDETTNMPFIKKTHSTNHKDCDCVRSINMDMLRDEKKTNTRRNIENLELLFSEARRQLQDIAQRVPIRDDVGRTVQYPSLNDDEMRMLADDPMVVEKYPDDTFLENEHLKLRINNTTGQITHIIYENGTESPFSIKMLYYPGCVGDNTEFTKRSSGAYIFRPNATRPYELEQNYSKVIKGNVVDEYHYANSGYASGVVRVYKHASLNYVENEWLVGPIPIDDDVGKEIVVRYVTDVVNNGEFYTDSNGRQMLKRKLNKRPQWNASLEEPIAGNYYPVTNRIFIENGKRISVLIDRSEGGSSIEEGTVELMLHRRLLHDDAFGVGEALNETAKGLGLVVRGKHKIILSNVNDKQAAIEEKKKVLENHLQPLVFVSDAKTLALTDWLTLKNKIGGIKTSVPKGVHVLTLEPFEEGSLLIRLENYLEKSDLTDTNIEIDLRDIFNDIKFKSYQETTLSANQWLSDYDKWTWNKDEQFKDSFNNAYGNYEEVNDAADGVDSAADDGFKIVLKAKQIRTFVVKYEL